MLSEQWALEALRLRRIKLALFDDMNDPFELLGVDLPKRSDRVLFEKLKSEMSQTVGVLCFSRAWSSPVLWSHYADRHRGICLGFDIPIQHAKKVTYSGKRLPAEAERALPQGSKKTLGYRLLTTKFEHWRYEDEVRLIVELKYAVQDAGHYFVPFGPALRLKKIVVGARCEYSPHQLGAAIESDATEVEIIQARLAFRTFRVVRNKAAKSRSMSSRGD